MLVHQSRREPLMIGKSCSTSNSTVPVADRWYRKCVFYVDNVDDSVTTNDLGEFVQSLSVCLVSCLEVKPRRRRNAAALSNSKAFRLRISREDRDRLLDADKWPAYVGVSDWIISHRPLKKRVANVASQTINNLRTRPTQSFGGTKEQRQTDERTVIQTYTHGGGQTWREDD